MLNRIAVLGLLFIFQLILINPESCFAVELADSGGNKGCSSLTSDEIKDVIITKIKAPAAKVLSVNRSAISGLCEIIFDNKGRMGIFYITPDKKYLVIGPVWETANMFNVTQESLNGVKDKKRIDVANISLQEAIILGESNAPKKVIIFTDPDCPFCSQLHNTMKQIVAKRKDIAFYIKLYPLNIHRDAYWKAKSIVCNRSLKMLEDNFDKKEIPKTECVTKEPDDSMKLAVSLGISGTPAIILPDGRLRDGALPEAELIDLIDGKK